MKENDNVEILRKGYELWNESKGAASQYWFDLMAEDVKWRSVVDERSPGMEFAKDCECKADVIQYFQTLGNSWEMEYCNVDEYIAQGDRVVAIGTSKWKNIGTGKSAELKKVDIFRMQNRMIVEFCEYYDTAKAIAAAVAGGT